MLRFEISKRFVAGFLTCWAITSIQQDILGMEGTVRMVVNHWISAWITVPLAIAALIEAVVLCNPTPEA